MYIPETGLLVAEWKES